MDNLFFDFLFRNTYIKLNPEHEEVRRVVDGLLHHDPLEVALLGGDALHRRRAHHVRLGLRQGAVVRLLRRLSYRIWN